MNEVAVSYSEKDLLIFFQQLRLQKAKELSEVNANRNFNKKEGASFKETINSFGRFLERNMKSTDTVKNNAKEALEKFNAKNEHVMSLEEVKNELDRLFENDNYGLAKLVFGASIILDNEYSYEYLEEGLNEASSILYGNPETLFQIKTQLEENYRSLSFGSLKSSEINMAVCLIGLSLLLAPITAAATLVVGAAVGGIAAHQVISKNKEKLKEDFKNSSLKDNAFYLAMQLTYIQRIYKSINEDDFKEELDSILKHIEELKSDFDYYLFVERNSLADNKEKLLMLNAFDKRLMKVLEIEK